MRQGVEHRQNTGRTEAERKPDIDKPDVARTSKIDGSVLDALNGLKSKGSCDRGLNVALLTSQAMKG